VAPASDHLATQMLRGDTFDANCRSRDVLVSMTGKWSVLILVALGGGTMRFAELRRRVNGVSERMLAESLRQLVCYRLVERRSLPVVPPHVEYTLTSLGREAASHLGLLTDWIETNVMDLLPSE
jgi:DNA-binding HxlR family transcriptional regulator